MTIGTRAGGGSVTLSCVNLATVAAFTAAGIALIVGVFSVVWGARLSSRAQLEQWRRNEERPIVARMLTLSEDVLRHWGYARLAKEKWTESWDLTVQQALENSKDRDEAVHHWEAGSELYDKLRFETAQLDLIAGRPVRDVAVKLVRLHDHLRVWLRPAGGNNTPLDHLGEQSVKIDRLHAELVDKTRADLGLATSDR